MKKNILNAFAVLISLAGATACGNGFLDTNYYSGVDVDNGLSSADNVGTALNGIYYQVCRAGFAGNDILSIADIPSDIAYWNGDYGHWDSVYKYTYTDTESYLEDIWQYCYKIIDNSARIINATAVLYDDSSESEREELSLYTAEAYALRGYARQILVNTFCHQVKVVGQDFSSWPGIVLGDDPIEAYATVSRATVGESYEAILSDYQNSLSWFETAGGDRGNKFYIGVAAVYGLLARASLYLERWGDAAQYAQAAVDESGITSLAYNSDSYKDLYYDTTSNTESFFCTAVTSSNNVSSNSIGNLWSGYGFSPTKKMQDLYSATDCRTSIFTWGEKNKATDPFFSGGKYAYFASNNPPYATSCLVNAPEQFLIIAEAEYNEGDLNAAKEALLIVARRDAAITSTADLPAGSDEFYAFLKDERARELFQEGFRVWDLRRWDERAEVYCYGAPNYDFHYTDYKISDLLFPIPDAEVSAGFGVEQNDGWSATKPQ